MCKNTKPIIIVIVNSRGHFTFELYRTETHNRPHARTPNQIRTWFPSIGMKWMCGVFFHFSHTRTERFFFQLDSLFFLVFFVASFVHTFSVCFRLFFNFIWMNFVMVLIFENFSKLGFLLGGRGGRYSVNRSTNAVKANDLKEIQMPRTTHSSEKSSKFTH